MEERHSKEKIITLDIYTDGSCKRQGKTLTFGGWAYIIISDGTIVRKDSGSEFGTTNQRMELTAIREALNYVRSIRRPHERIVIYSDSSYAINCYQQDWYIRWLKNGWTSSTGKEVANIDLWQDIIPYFDNFWYSFRKVNAHTGQVWNEQCDKLAQEEANLLKKTFRGTSNAI